jgi:hypothetical protein
MGRWKGENAMGQKAADGMNACAVLGAAFARGCAPEGAAPMEFGAATGIPKTPQWRSAHVEAVLKAITQRFRERESSKF